MKNVAHSSQRVEITQVSLTNGWINKMWSVHMAEYYAAIKRKEEVIHAATWMNLENTAANPEEMHSSQVTWAPVCGSEQVTY